MKNPFRRRHKYKVHNPPPEFATDAGKELYLMMLDIREEIGFLKATVGLVSAVVMIVFAATVVKDYL